MSRESIGDRATDFLFSAADFHWRCWLLPGTRLLTTVFAAQAGVTPSDIWDQFLVDKFGQSAIDWMGRHGRQFDEKAVQPVATQEELHQAIAQVCHPPSTKLHELARDLKPELLLPPENTQQIYPQSMEKAETGELAIQLLERHQALRTVAKEFLSPGCRHREHSELRRADCLRYLSGTIARSVFQPDFPFLEGEREFLLQALLVTLVGKEAAPLVLREMAGLLKEIILAYYGRSAYGRKENFTSEEAISAAEGLTSLWARTQPEVIMASDQAISNLQQEKRSVDDWRHKGQEKNPQATQTWQEVERILDNAQSMPKEIRRPLWEFLGVGKDKVKVVADLEHNLITVNAGPAILGDPDKMQKIQDWVHLHFFLIKEIQIIQEETSSPRHRLLI